MIENYSKGKPKFKLPKTVKHWHSGKWVTFRITKLLRVDNTKKEYQVEACASGRPLYCSTDFWIKKTKHGWTLLE